MRLLSGRHRPSDWLLYATVALAPLPFGSVAPVWVCIWCVAVALSLTFADLGDVALPKLVWLAPPLVAFAAVLGSVAVQQHDLVPVSATDRFWRMTQVLGAGDQIVNRATLDPGWRALGPSLLFTLIFVRTFLLAQSRDKAERLLRVVSVSAVAYACLSMVSLITDPSMLLWRTKRAYLDNVTGTFINRNTAATYFGSASVLWFLQGLRRLRRTFAADTAVSLAREIVLAGVPRKLILDGLGFGICFAATLATGSRAGTFVTIVAIAIATALWFRSWRLRSWLYFGSGCALLIGGLLQIWGGSLMHRIETRPLWDVDRAEAYTAVMKMIHDFPWFGIGLGQFEFVFPAYRAETSVTIGVWDKAHSVPLELAAEVGIPAACVVGLAWLVTGCGLIRGLRRLIYGRIFPIAGLSIGVLGTVHGIVDFSLQIPGYAVTFAAVTAASLARSVRTPQSKLRSFRRTVSVEAGSRTATLQTLSSEASAASERGGWPRTAPTGQIEGSVHSEPPSALTST